MNLNRWTLASKLMAVGLAFLVLALGSIALTLWVSWQLEGGAAAVNEAGRMRMLSYRMTLAALSGADAAERRGAVETLDASLERLRTGDPSRPLFIPWNDDTRAGFAAVRERWRSLRLGWLATGDAPSIGQVDGFVALVDGFVGSIEQQVSYWTSVLRGFQLTLVALAIGSAVAFLYTGYLFVLDPLQRLQRGVMQVSNNDFSARVVLSTQDEFGRLAEGFNSMAEHLQALYRDLESKVEEKTAGLEIKRQRLAALYEVSAFIAQAESLPALSQGFAALVRRIARADGVAVRWSDESNERYLMLAADGLPADLMQAEQCLPAGDCHCGQASSQAGLRVIAIHPAEPSAGGQCGKLGYRTLLTVPVRLQQRVLGELDLFFAEAREFGDEERTLYETLGAHLASGIESLRATALEKEAAVAQERGLLAQELHDSIAQSLAFLKIQVALLHKAVQQQDRAAIERTLGELDAGVRESYGDVRELLVHFRTRASSEDIEPALRSTLQKFEHQSGVRTHLVNEGHGVPLPADVQIQVLHVVQEALSNVRKHARATQVTLRVQQAPHWRFEVADDGIGFDPQAERSENHVGLRIMRERAARIGARVEIHSSPTAGTRIALDLPTLAATASTDAPGHAHELADSLAGR